jgi:hypothetical protein
VAQRVGTTTTAANGIYNFADLIPGDYLVMFIAPTGYIPSPQDVGANDALDSDADINTGEAVYTTLVPDEDDLTWDAGYIPLTSIGDRVWLDSDNDGRQDGGEPGFPTSPSAAGWQRHSIDTTHGCQRFICLKTCRRASAIEIVPPADHVFSPQNVGSDDGDSDADRMTGALRRPPSRPAKMISIGTRALCGCIHR